MAVAAFGAVAIVGLLASYSVLLSGPSGRQQEHEVSEDVPSAIDDLDGVDFSLVQLGYEYSGRERVASAKAHTKVRRLDVAEAIERVNVPGFEADFNVEAWLRDTQVLPFNLWLWIPMLTCWSLTVVHEFYVKAGGFPLLGKKYAKESVAIQWVSVVTQVLHFTSITLTLPLTLDFAIACGVHVAWSALALPLTFPLAFVVLGKYLQDSDWNQPLARWLLIWTNIGGAFIFIGWSLFLNYATSFSIEGRLWVWLGQQAWFQVIGFVSGLAIFPLMGIQNLACPVQDKTYWMLIANMGRNFGMIAGPAAFCIIQWLLRKPSEPELNPISNMGWMFMTQALMRSILALMNSLVYANSLTPSVLEAIPEHQVQAAEEQSRVAQQLLNTVHEQLAMDHLEPEARKNVLRKILYFLAERDTTAAAVEVSTLMILEMCFHWDASMTGLGFAGTALGGCVFAALTAVFLRPEWESVIFAGAMVLSLFGCFFLFDVPGTGWAFLLVGDFFVYGASSASVGIAKGWAQHACMPGTEWDYKWFRTVDMTRDVIFRTIGPILGRLILDLTSRNGYALFQVLLMGAGTWTCIDIVTTCRCGKLAKHNMK